MASEHSLCAHPSRLLSVVVGQTRRARSGQNHGRRREVVTVEPTCRDLRAEVANAAYDCPEPAVYGVRRIAPSRAPTRFSAAGQGRKIMVAGKRNGRLLVVARNTNAVPGLGLADHHPLTAIPGAGE